MAARSLASVLLLFLSITFGTLANAGQVYPRQTSFSNSTRTTTPSSSSVYSASTSITSPPCCWIWAGFQGVKVNSWYTETVHQYTATVITTFIKYNNTVVPGNSTTLYLPRNDTFTTFGYYGQPLNDGITITNLPIPSQLIPKVLLYDGEYGASTIVRANETAVSFDFTDLVIQSPTPYALFPVISVWLASPPYSAIESLTAPPTSYPSSLCGANTQVRYLSYTAGNWSYVNKTEFLPPLGLNELLQGGGSLPGGDEHYDDLYLELQHQYVVPLPAALPNDDVYVSLPSGVYSSMIANHTLLSKYPWITNCWTAGGEGQPTVHVQVNQLTTDSSMTVTSNAVLGAQATSTPAAASSTPTALPVSETGAASSSPTNAGNGGQNTSPSTNTPTSTQTATNGGANSPSTNAQSTTNAQQTTNGVAGNNSPSTNGQVTSNGGAGGNTQQASNNGGGNANTAATQQGQATGTAQNGAAGQTSAAIVPVTLGSTTASVSIGSSNAVIGSTTLSVGGSAITSNGQTISLASQSSGVAVVVNGNTQTPAQPATTPAVGSVTVGGSVVSFQLSSSAAVIGGTTLSVGGPAVTTNGQTLSLVSTSGGVALVGGGSTQALTTPGQQLVTLGSQVLTVSAASRALIVNGVTLTSGVGVINGETVSLAGTNLVVASGASTTIQGIGGAIASGLGVASYTGAAARLRPPFRFAAPRK